MGPLNTIVPDKTVWHQLVFVIDAAGNYKIYQNAQEAFSETGVSFGFDAGRGVCLGASTLGNRDNPCLDGWLDDVQLYNWPLELNHIETLYNNPGSVIDPNNDGTRLPVGRWNFENENDPWADSSGNGYHGTHVFAPPVMATRTTEDVGVGLGALSSSGASDDVIELPYMLDHFSEEQGSLALWVKLERDPPLTNQDGLLEFSTATEEVRYPFADPCDPDSHITTLRDSRFDVNLNTMVPDKTVWHHLVFTIDTEGNYKIYQNGQEVAGDTGAAFGLGSRAYLLGQGQAGYPRLDGYLDDVQLYNYALSAANVLYLSEHPGQTVGCLGNLRADVNGDCIVDLLDLAAFGSEWLMDGRAR